MTINDLNQINKAPDSGWIIAYFRTDVIFQRYTAAEQISVLSEGKELLEIHLFNKDKEYRAIATRDKRFQKGVIEHLAEFPNDKESVYREEALINKDLLPGSKKISVLNHLSYDEEGMLAIDDYRLVVEA